VRKRYTLLRYFVFLILMATFVACASTPTRESTGEYIDDSVITTKIKSLLLKDDLLKSFHISVKTYKGVVQLSGSVDSPKAADKAGQIARSVKGVKSVKNNLVAK
jgi:osmotically-inducible protein OsmY